MNFQNELNALACRLKTEKAMKYAIMVLALVGVLARPAAAIGLTTGNQMLSMCKSAPVLCVTYAMGWQHAHLFAVMTEGAKKGLKKADNIKRTAPTNICFPKNATYGQSGDVLIKYLQDHPEKRHEPLSGLAALAFIKAFPCR